MDTEFLSENINVRDHVTDLGVDGRIIFKRIVKKQGVWTWTGFNWFSTGFSGGLLW